MEKLTMKAVHPIVGQKKARPNTSNQGKSNSKLASNLASAPASELISELRTQALSQIRGELPLIQSRCRSLYGMLIETALVDRVTSLVVFSDGSTSWYVSTGHACIGCGEAPKINAAAKRLLATASELVDCAESTKDQSPPQPGCMRLFLLTDAGLKRIDIHPHSNDALLHVLRESERLLQHIERSHAGVSLEQAITEQAASSVAVTSSTFSANAEPTCLSAGNAARRSLL
jgi:hypothetical protein